MHTHTIFVISDGTGITAETFGTAIMAQFESKPRLIRIPFVDSMDKIHQAVRQINHVAEVEKRKPIIFTTLVNQEMLEFLEANCKGKLFDMFGTFVRPLEVELGQEVAAPRGPLCRHQREQGISGAHGGHQLHAGSR